MINPLPGSRRAVRVVAAAAFGPAGIQYGTPAALSGGPLLDRPAPSVPGFDPARWALPRKHIKTMTRAVQLGVAAAGAAIQSFPDWKLTPPARRGLYVGASPQSGDAEDMIPAVDAWKQSGDLSLNGFARAAIPIIPPLWLVKGLSNNILGYAAAQWDLQGDNGNWCDGRRAGAVALNNAIHAVAEGRVDLAIAGGADCLVGADALIHAIGAEAAAFFVLVPCDISGDASGDPGIGAGHPTDEGCAAEGGEAGAASVPLTLARAWLAGRAITCGGIRL